MIKEKKSLKNETSSRRKFFKTAAKAGAVAAATVAMPNIASAGIAEGEVEADTQRTSAFVDGEVDMASAEATGELREAALLSPDLDDKGLPIAYTLQVVSMANRADADQVAQKLRTLSYKAYVVEVERPEGVRYRVYVGPKYEKAALAPVKRAVDKALSVDSIVVRYWP